VVGTISPIADLSADFDTYWVDWQPDIITILVDDAVLGVCTPESLPTSTDWSSTVRCIVC
jgi:beta-glucanase (GH16 family)